VNARSLGPLLLLLLSACAGPSIANAPSRPPLIDATAEQIVSHVRGTRARAIIVNVWATWCDPCKAEIPDFLRVYELYRDRGVELILVSADVAQQRADAEQFLLDQHVGFATYFRSGPDMEFIDTIEPRWSGALPATLVYAHGGRLLHFQEGQVSYEQLEKWVRGVLDSPP
jgi:thiol-disulfide isomerase/thioredoxin